MVLREFHHPRGTAFAKLDHVAGDKAGLVGVQPHAACNDLCPLGRRTIDLPAKNFGPMRVIGTKRGQTAFDARRGDRASARPDIDIAARRLPFGLIKLRHAPTCQTRALQNRMRHQAGKHRRAVITVIGRVALVKPTALPVINAVLLRAAIRQHRGVAHVCANVELMRAKGDPLGVGCVVKLPKPVVSLIAARPIVRDRTWEITEGRPTC